MKAEAVAEVRRLEAKYNQGKTSGQPGEKAVPWWDGPQPTARARGKLRQADCLGRRIRLVIEADDGKTIRLLLRTHRKSPLPVVENRRWPAGHRRTRRWSSGISLRRTPRQAQRAKSAPSSSSEPPHQPLVGAGDLRPLLRHQLPRPAIAGKPRSTASRRVPISYTGYGLVVAAFSLTYAGSAPFAGLLIDRIGLDAGATLAVGVWSLAGIATGFARGLTGLVCCRAVLGLAEAGGIPAVGKAIARYLPAPERALGNSINQAAVSFGAILAPPVATFLALRFNWRMAFVVTGAAGLLWILAWHWTAAARNPSKRKRPEPNEPWTYYVTTGCGSSSRRTPSVW